MLEDIVDLAFKFSDTASMGRTVQFAGRAYEVDRVRWKERGEDFG